MKTYLYNRVSSGKQSKKDGLKRQSESTEVFDFIKKHKLQVVKQMDYIGSSFAGKNFDSETVLGKFVEAVKTGTIATPVCLCFENWDRFGRDVEWKNTKRFLDLIDVNVSIGVVSMDVVIDQKLLAKNSDILQLVVNDIHRARKESERKSGFSKRNLLVKVANAKSGQKIYFGGQSPRWITGVKNNTFITDRQMLEDIHRIFDLYLAGGSCVGIAKILNSERKDTLGVSRKNPTNKTSRTHWFNTTVRNVLTHKSLTGWCRVNDFESEDYYPEIISPARFLKVQKLISKNAERRGGGKTGNIPNIFCGILYCQCGGKICARKTRVKEHDYNYMACRRSQVNICKDKTIWKMNELEETILAFILEKTPDELLFKPKPNPNGALIAKLNLEMSNKKSAIKRALQILDHRDDGEMPELESKLGELNLQKKLLAEKISAEESKFLAVNENPIAVERFKHLMKGADHKALHEAANSIHTRLKDERVRKELREVMPEVITRITCHLEKWEFDVEFANGTKKHYLFYD